MNDEQELDQEMGPPPPTNPDSFFSSSYNSNASSPRNSNQSSTTNMTTAPPSYLRNSGTHSGSKRFDASHAMDRLRDSFVGGTDYHVMMSSEDEDCLSPPSTYDDEQQQEEEEGLYGGLSPLQPKQHHNKEAGGDSNSAAADTNNNLTTAHSSTGTLQTANKRKATSQDKYFSSPPQRKHPRRRKDNSLPKQVQKHHKKKKDCNCLKHVLHQIPAVALIALFHLMIGIPFGVSYFPIGWKEHPDTTLMIETNTDDEDYVVRNLQFPLPGKEALGIRMFLFSTIIGQIIFTFSSGFHNPISIQMVENTPFMHSLSTIVISHVGGGIEALSTLFVMFGLASILVGVVFYTLGKLEQGRIIYFFPSHVLVGCIGGIGIFIAKTGVEVGINTSFSIMNIESHLDLFGAVLFFEILLRVLENVTKDANGKPRYSLLSPIYFCSITPIFYTALWIWNIPLQDAEDAGYFFPPIDVIEKSSSAADLALDSTTPSSSISSFMQSIFTDDLFDIWKVVNFSNICWPAIVDSIPTLVALTLFSLIHVPINIPAFALSTNTEADMNKELIAHGYSNIFAGLFGGLQNYMAYTQSVLYDRSGGMGRGSGVAVAIVTSMLFVVGPTVGTYIPRCMAGTLLLHVGFDLFLEGVYDSYGKFDALEYTGIWVIVIVMTLYGMDAAMIAGVIAAISTYAVQTVAYLHPIRGNMSGATLRSSTTKNRNHGANAILDSEDIGRKRILVVQLQGHLFFGNMAQLNESMSDLLSSKCGTNSQPWIVIMDFSLVLGIDSSAAQAIVKLKKLIQKNFDVTLCVFVTGSSDGFPCASALSEELSDFGTIKEDDEYMTDTNDDDIEPNEETPLSQGLTNKCNTQERFRGSHVCESLDLAIAFSENALIAKQDPSLIDDGPCTRRQRSLSFQQEEDLMIMYLKNVCPDDAKDSDIERLASYFVREVYCKDDRVWEQGSPGDCAKLIIRGKLIALIENEAGTSETVDTGNFVGELSLVRGVSRMSSVYCMSEEATLFSISRESYKKLQQEDPHVARFIDYICITYLAHRVQHVSNRIFETRCLPI